MDATCSRRCAAFEDFYLLVVRRTVACEIAGGIEAGLDFQLFQLGAAGAILRLRAPGQGAIKIGRPVIYEAQRVTDHTSQGQNEDT